MSDKYTFDLSKPHRMENFAAPYLDTRYVRELTEIGGLNRFDEPNLIFEWGPTALETDPEDGEVAHKPYAYLCTVEKMASPQLIHGIHAVTNFKQDIGRPRWFVAQWIAPEVAGELWPRGRYIFFMRIDGPQGTYSGINGSVMDRIRGHLEYLRNRTPDSYAAEVLASVSDVGAGL